MIICKKACRLIRHALHKLTIILCVLFVSCEWVNDDLSGCATGTWLHFTYTYNILDVDAAYNQVDNLSIFIFDDENKYVGMQEVDSLQFQQDNALVEINQPQGEYRILVWGGLYDTNYNCSELVQGVTLYQDALLSLSKSGEADENSDLLDYLFHCSLDTVVVTNYYNIIEAPLVKNTNHFSILIQDVDNNEFEADDFGVVLRSDNGVIDYSNNIVAGNSINYTPYSQFITEVSNTSLDGTTEIYSTVVSYINTLRLMLGDDTTLTIINKATDERIIDISLIQYLILTRSYYTVESMDDQEYLDRQDSYSLIFYLEKCDGVYEESYVCTKVSVNGWIVRFNEAELSK